MATPSIGIDLGTTNSAVATATGGTLRLIERATGQRPSLPARVGDLFEREERCSFVAGDYATVAQFVAERAAPKA